VSLDREELRREAWRDFLESVTKEHDTDDASIEVLSTEFGDQQEAERIPLAYIEYDDRDDAVIIGVGGRNSRYPVLLRHTIPHPRQIFVHPPAPNVTRAIEIVGEDGDQTIVTLHPRPALPR
jgi:hypothetical protein